ncbi:MAG: hypothetical protein M4579_002424 [Chaenotheca gracillima]|nr:MAG: hypothetical protein M4579_002424 [Chaenotheca gracillima]
MSSLSASRAVLRRGVLRSQRCVRQSSTTSEAAQAASTGASKASGAASNVTSKASEGLSRVTSSAGPAISGAARGVGNALGRIGGRTGRFIGFVESMIPPTVYYSKVGFELSKIVFRGQKMSPPSLQAFQSYFQPLIHAARNPSGAFSTLAPSTQSLAPSNILNSARNVDRQQLVTLGVISAELLGFFTVGEMVGRMKIVGYRGEKEEHH